MAKLNRINLPQGGITKVAEAVSLDRNTVSKYLNGMFDEYSKCYAQAITVRETAKKMFNLK